MNLFPQTLLDENREPARKLFRDRSSDDIQACLEPYATILINTYRSQDLISTSGLRRLATNINSCCFKLIADGFVDDGCYLHSIAALASDFGSALDGSKEVQMAPEPCFDIEDLLIYRTRCLYLFWCADWLASYLKNPTIGPFMMVDAREAREWLVGMSNDMGNAAKLLLRNWVAWGLLMEKNGF